ncbi:MAG: hypothetical protein ACQEUA_12400, partial [Halobacteriota archaeon]
MTGPPDDGPADRVDDDSADRTDDLANRVDDDSTDRTDDLANRVDDDSTDRTDDSTLPNDRPTESGRPDPAPPDSATSTADPERDDDPVPVTDGGFADESGEPNEPRIAFYGGKWASTVP